MVGLFPLEECILVRVQARQSERSYPARDASISSGGVPVINETINRKILAIWKKHFVSRDDVLAPIFYDDFKQGGILFVGMNPSFSPPKIRLIVRDTEFENLEPESFYRWSNIVSDEKNIDICIKLSKNISKTDCRLMRSTVITDLNSTAPLCRLSSPRCSQAQECSTRAHMSVSSGISGKRFVLNINDRPRRVLTSEV